MTTLSTLLLALLQITPAENDVLRRLDTARVESMTRHLSEVIAQSPSGAGFGSAVSGSPEERALASVVAVELEKLGLEVRRERFPVRAFDYGEVVLSANGRPLPAITLHSGGGTWGTWDGIPYRRGNRADGRTLVTTLVDAGRGMAADYATLGDVTGAAVLVEWKSWPGFAIFEAAAQGASAVLFHDYPGSSLDDALKQNTVIYHDAIPSVSISIEEASSLKRALSEGQVAVELTNRVDAELGFSENVIGVLRGSDVADEWVAATSHHDRWFRGAQDDAVGVSVVLELARVLSTRSSPPRRSHLFISFGSEETGGADVELDWLRGSHAFVEAHPEIASRLAYAFNVDGAGWPAERGYFYGTLEAAAFHEKLLEDAGLSDRVTLKRGVTDWVDAWTLAAVGGASSGYLLWFEAHGQDGPDAFSPYYHTQHDRVGVKPYTNLEHDLRVAALSLLRVDASDALPFELDDVARFVLEELEEVRSAGVLSDEVDEAERQARALLSTTSSATDTDDWRIENLRWMRARRELVPWLLSLSSVGAVLKTSPYLDDFLALRRAREAAERGDVEAARDAVAEVSTMSWGVRLSPSAYRAERLMSYARSDWSRAFDQSPRPAADDIQALYRSLEGEAIPPNAVARLRELEAVALEGCREALFVIAGKLEKAVTILEGESVLGAPPVGRAR